MENDCFGLLDKDIIETRGLSLTESLLLQILRELRRDDEPEQEFVPIVGFK